MNTEATHCDFLIFGSGITGMTLSMLLAECGYKVMLVEKSNVIGGCMQRFYRKGVPFDTGFHFTAGLTGCMGDMFRVLRFQDQIGEIPIRTRLRLERQQCHVHLPRGRAAVLEYLGKLYPAHKVAIRTYFEREKEIFEQTALFNLHHADGFSAMRLQDADFLPLADFLDTLNLPEELRLILASFASCYGTPPQEASLASHCRVSYGLWENMVRLRGGGGKFVQLFRQRAQELGIAIKRECTLESCLQIERKQCHQVRLTDGTEVSFRDCIFTIHPHAIAELLPREVQTVDFQERLAEFEEGCGFFTVFGILDPPLETFTPELTSCMNMDHAADLMTPDQPDARVTGIMLTEEESSTGRPYQTVTAFENVYPAETHAWENTVCGQRGDAYRQYKSAKTRAITATIENAYPEFKNRLRILESASMLTYRDYLSPYGSAYGIRQKVGQHNLFGKLPLRNFYAAGQNALLPGAMGAMLSAFILWRKLVGEDKYREILREHLSPEEATP